MALIWLRVYPTYELLGFFFDLHKRNAQLNVRDVLATLETLDDFPFDRPGRGAHETPLGRRSHGGVPAGPGHYRQQGAAGEPAHRVRGPEAVLLGEEDGAHAQGAGGGRSVWPDRAGQRLGLGRGQPRPVAAA